MKKKIKYSDFTTPAQQSVTRFTPVSTPAVESSAPAPAAPKKPTKKASTKNPSKATTKAGAKAKAPAPVITEAAAPVAARVVARVSDPVVAAVSAAVVAPRTQRNSAPIDLARALAKARATEALKAAETLSHVEARAAAAHARGLAQQEAAAAVSAEMAPPLEFTPLLQTQPDDESNEWEVDEAPEPRGPRRPLRERARNRDGIAELLMFRIGPERFAVELICVEEAIDLPDVHHVPEMPPAMLGVITVRGTLTPVFTPDAALGVPVQGKSAALIFRSDRGRFALAIDDVDDVMTLDLSLLRDAPGSDVADSVVLGVARNEGAIVALVDADALVLACQAIPALELV
jgi:purine-binding chemotaxis protein CheW